jgi:KH domain
MCVACRAQVQVTEFKERSSGKGKDYIQVAPATLQCPGPLCVSQLDVTKPYDTMLSVSHHPWCVMLQILVLVEQDSQRPILLGRQGAQLKRLATDSRHAIEEFLGERVSAVPKHV